MAEWKTTANVAIIGGGIMGASTAYHLAKRGCSDVVILEKDLLAQASTGLSAGGIRQQFSHPANIRLSQEAVRVFERFQDEFGVDIEFRQVGYLFLAQSDEVWQEFLANVEVQRRYGVPVEALSPEEIKHRWPYLHVDDLRGCRIRPAERPGRLVPGEQHRAVPSQIRGPCRGQVVDGVSAVGRRVVVL